MRFRFVSKKIEALYTEEKGASKYPADVVEAFFEAMAVIKAAFSEGDLYALKGFHFEKLKGKRGKENERSLRLNSQWRLIVKVESDDNGKLLLVLDIEDYH
ncbi:MAG: type II toxin-antitoxin system RelE/ParE family toxin [Firmicutes bacterium]|nr:type II toxin-antitoxin system RelE/ParE family toxin [Bacillota bacterium]